MRSRVRGIIFDYIFTSGSVGHIAVALSQNLLAVEESPHKFEKFADFAAFPALEEESAEVELRQRNASWILENPALGYATTSLYLNLSRQLLDECRTAVIAVSIPEGRKAHIFRSYAQKPPGDGNKHPSTSDASDAEESQEKVKVNPAGSFVLGTQFILDRRSEDGSLDYPNPSVEAFKEVNRVYKTYRQDNYANFQSKREHKGTRSGVGFFLSIGAGNSALISSGLEDHEKKYRENLSALTEGRHARMLQLTNEKGLYRNTLYLRLDVRNEDIWGIAPDDEKADGNGKKRLAMIEAVTEKYLAQADVDEALHKLAGPLVRLRRKRL